MSDERVIVPTGPGKGQERSLMEALQAVIGEMRGHARDLCDNGEPEQAELLERYGTAFEEIWQQSFQRRLYGVWLPEELHRAANTYHLALPQICVYLLQFVGVISELTLDTIRCL